MPPPQDPAASALPVWRAQDLVSAIGINVHVGYANSTYAATGRVIEALRYLGVTSVRESIPTVGLLDPRQAPFEALFAAGFRVALSAGGLIPPPSGFPSQLAAMQRNLDNIQSRWPGQILAVEGLNEPDIAPDRFIAHYDTAQGAAAVARFQIELQTMLKRDTRLAHLPIWEFNLNSPPYNEKMYEAVYAANPAVLKAFDVASRGVYAGVWSPFFQLRQQMLSPFDVSVDGARLHAGPYQAAIAGRPVIVKETGLAASPIGMGSQGVTDYQVQAKVLPTTLFDTFKLGARQSFVYELADLHPDPALREPSAHFGLFDSAWRAKPVALTLHNIVRRLADTTADFTPNPIQASVTDFPLHAVGAAPSGFTLVTQKHNGEYDVLLWYEPLLWDSIKGRAVPPVSPVPVTLQFGLQCGHTRVYDPLVDGTVQGPDHTTAVRVWLPDHLVIVVCTPR